MGGNRGCKVRLPLLGQQSTSSVHDTTKRQSTKLHWYSRLGLSSPSLLSDRDSRSGRIVVTPPDPYRPTYDVFLRDETPRPESCFFSARSTQYAAPSRASFLPHNNLHPPILRLDRVTRSLDQGLALAAPGGLNDFRRDPAPDHQVFHAHGTLQGERVVVLIGAGKIGVADNCDLRRRPPGDLGDHAVDRALGGGIEFVRSLHEVDHE